MIKILKKIKQIITTQIEYLRYRKFFEIKAHTHGMLKPQAYAAIFQYAKLAGKGPSIEIGSAQGAATISLALGRVMADSESHVYAFEKCEKSGALRDWNGKQDNIAVLQQNITDFGLQEKVTVIPENVHHSYERISIHAPFSMLVIDSDGAVDKVFQHFFNQLKPGAIIVIDDYEEKIKIPKSIIQPEGIPGYLIEKEVSSLDELCPMGKHYTTWKITNYFIEKGYLTKLKIIGNTLIGMKPTNITKPIEWDWAAFKAIRQEILSQYESRNSQTTS